MTAWIESHLHHRRRLLSWQYERGPFALGIQVHWREWVIGGGLRIGVNASGFFLRLGPVWVDALYVGRRVKKP